MRHKWKHLGLKPWWGASNLTNLPPSSASAFIIIAFSLLKKEWFNGRKTCWYYTLVHINYWYTGLLQVASLLDHLIQLSKTGFSKATQRLEGIYALFVVLRLAAVDTKAGFYNFFLYPSAFLYTCQHILP